MGYGGRGYGELFCLQSGDIVAVTEYAANRITVRRRSPEKKTLKNSWYGLVYSVGWVYSVLTLCHQTARGALATLQAEKDVLMAEMQGLREV